MEKSKIIQSNSTSKPVSSVLYASIDADGHIMDDKWEMTEIYQRFKRMFEKGQMLYIFHKGENGDKDHVHFLARNNTHKGFTNLNTLKKDVFFTLSKIENDKYKIGQAVPLHRLNTSTFIDWFGYALHDPKYFEKIGLEYDKEFIYSYNDILGDVDFKEEVIELYEDFINGANEKNFFVDYINEMQNGKTDFEIMRKVSKYATPDNMASIVRGITETRKVFSSDMDTITRAFCLLEPFIRNNSCLSENLVDICVKQCGRELSFNEIAFTLFKDYLKNLTSKNVIDLLLSSGG